MHNEEYLRVIGRAKEVINIGGEKLIPQEVEGVLLQIPFIKDCLVYGELSHITGQIVCAKIVLDRQFLESLYCEDSNNSSWQSLLSCGGDNIAGFQPNVREIKKALRLFCQDKIASFKIPSKIEIVESLAISQRFKKIRNNHV
ncbi:hypothetical protein CQA66_00020 [Helicobacter aurati]|uniref:Uncharacterized protein n=1 Tax=Helicobacter aurati TaxID=137778 RepID=A0A3D8J9P5_9HELI|nr:hypothetical protein CQA66_00020 [Helicobacter aurati]